MKKAYILLITVIFCSLQGTITDNPFNLPYNKIRDRVGVETQEFRNRTPFNLFIVVYFTNGETTSLNVEKEGRAIINTNLLCTRYFVVYPTSRLPGEPTPAPTSIYVDECSDRITFIKYDYSGYFYSMTAHKI